MRRHAEKTVGMSRCECHNKKTGGLDGTTDQFSADLQRKSLLVEDTRLVVVVEDWRLIVPCVRVPLKRERSDRSELAH